MMLELHELSTYSWAMDLMAKEKSQNQTLMNDFYKKRTEAHINAVQRYCKALEDYDPLRFKGLEKHGSLHDQSKFSSNEIGPYTYYTWKIRCRRLDEEFIENSEMEKAFKDAWKHHYTVNKHHPEHYDNVKDMKDIYIAEMVCDWFAIGDEMGNSARSWADTEINKRWKFSDKQVDLIYELIGALENRYKDKFKWEDLNDQKET